MKIITKIISNLKFKRFCILSLLLILYIFVSAISYTNAVCMDISDNVFRLHVIANSDSKEDQNLKYIVRDNVLDYVAQISTTASSKEDIINILQNHLTQIEAIALDTIRKNGFDYSVCVEIGNFSFPTKKYGDIILPPGYYDSLKIQIGEATGQNWWCVMFPPLCFVDVTSGIVPEESKELLQSNLSEEEYNLISEESTDVKVVNCKSKI